MTQMILVSDMADVSSFSEVLLLKRVNSTTSKIRYNSTGDVTTVYSCFLFPVTYLKELTEIVTFRQNLKKQFDDSLGLITKLQNKITLESGEI